MSPKIFSALIGLSLLSACAPGPAFNEASLPPLAAGQARIFFLRDTTPDESQVQIQVALAGQRLGPVQPGGVAYHDVQPGTYQVTALGSYFGPDATRAVTLQTGQTAYVGIQTLEPGNEQTMGNANIYGPFLSVIDAAQARPVMAHLRFTGALGG